MDFKSSLRCDPESRDLCALQERVRLSKFASDKMHQRRLERQDTPPAQDPMRRRVLIDDVKGERSTAVTAIAHLSSVSSPFLCLFPDVSLNGCESLSDESPSSPTGPGNPVKCLSPAHQPAPPTSPPNRNAAPRLRRVSSLNRTRPPASHSSGERKYTIYFRLYITVQKFGFFIIIIYSARMH